MSNKKSVYNDSYDFAIIGSDLSAFALAHELYQKNKKVILIPSKDSLEDFNRTDYAHFKHSEPFSYLPVNDKNIELINILEDQFFLEQELFDSHTTKSPVTFEEGQFKDLLGFGERSFSTLNEINYYTESEQFLMTSTGQTWLEALSKDTPFIVLEKSYVTSIEVQKNKLSSITINGSKKIQASEYLFCAPPSELKNLIEPKDLKGRQRQKLVKAKIWSRVNLTFEYSQLFDVKSGMHVLMGTKDDFEPVVGQFLLSNKEDAPLVSHWSYLLDKEQAEDAELAGGIIKYMKRQIKRAYPESFELINFERISVHTDTHGHVEGMEDQYKFKGLDNLSLLSKQFSSHQGPLSGLDRVTSFLKATGIPAEIETVKSATR